jgi:hypothetical protein
MNPNYLTTWSMTEGKPITHKIVPKQQKHFLIGATSNTLNQKKSLKNASFDQTLIQV